MSRTKWRLFQHLIFPGGTASDLEVLGFTLTPSGSVQSADQLTINQIIFTVLDDSSNVSSTELNNIRVVRDVDENGVFNSGDEVLNSSGVAWNESTFTIVADQDDVVSSSVAEEFLLIMDATDATRDMVINVRIASASHITLDADNGIAGSATANNSWKQ